MHSVDVVPSNHISLPALSPEFLLFITLSSSVFAVTLIPFIFTALICHCNIEQVKSSKITFPQEFKQGLKLAIKTESPFHSNTFYSTLTVMYQKTYGICLFEAGLFH